MKAKLALLAKENIALDTLLEPKPETVQLPLEPIYECNNRIVGTIGEGKTTKEHTTENELGKLLPETNGDRNHVCGQTVGTGIPKDCVSAISQFGHRGKTNCL